MLLTVFLAPVVEEVLKSLVLIGLSKKMSYFVDGAIYGFASGIGFSVVENVLYLARESSGSTPLVAILRVFSTCLMHAAASALVGTAIGRLRYGRGITRVISLVLGWALAMGLHMAFNRLVRFNAGSLMVRSPLVPVLGGLGVGIGGAVLIVVFIRWGLREEKQWMQETLHMGVRVTRQEANMVQQYDQVDELLLQPIIERFGEEKADMVEQFLLKQAQFGIKSKARMMSQSAREQEQLQAEADKLHAEMEALRKKVGVFCMGYVRTVFDEETLEGMASRLADKVRLDGLPEDGGILQTAMAAKMDLSEQPAPRKGGGLYGRLAMGSEEPPSKE
jgi:hypothetical protein